MKKPDCSSDFETERGAFLALSDIDDRMLMRFAMQDITTLPRVMALLQGDVSTRLNFRRLSAVFKEEEINGINSNLLRAMREIRDFVGSGNVHRMGGEQRPFSMQASVPRGFVNSDGLQGVYQYNATNLVGIFEDSFFEDEETVSLVNFVRFNSVDSAPNFDLVVELTGNPLEEKDRMCAVLERWADPDSYNYKMSVHRVDLATALQSAILRAKEYDSNDRPVIIHTDFAGPNGGDVAVVARSGAQILLREVPQEVSPKEFLIDDFAHLEPLRGSFGVVSLIVRRPLVRA